MQNVLKVFSVRSVRILRVALHFLILIFVGNLSGNVLEFVFSELNFKIPDVSDSYLSKSSAGLPMIN